MQSLNTTGPAAELQLHTKLEHGRDVGILKGRVQYNQDLCLSVNLRQG